MTSRFNAVLGLVAAGGLVALPAGCQGGGRAAAAATADRGPGDGPLDPVERSRLREAAIDALLELTQSEDAQVRANAIEGLLVAPARLEAVLPGALADSNPGVRTVAAMAVGKAKLNEMADAVRPLAQDQSAFVKAAAIYALRSCGADVNPTPLGAMATGDPSPRVRAHAAYLLGELGDKGTSSLLREAAQLDVPRANPAELKVLSVQIAEALVKLGDREQIHTIRAALYPASPEELDATVLAAQVLGNLDDRGSAGQLQNLAAMRDPAGRPMPAEIRLAVAGALAAMGQPVSTEDAEAALAGAELSGQIQGAWVLGQIGGPAAVRALEGRLGETSERLRVAVAAGLLRAVAEGRSQ